jgi:iron complex outermembrane receptor protein
MTKDALLLAGAPLVALAAPAFAQDATADKAPSWAPDIVVSATRNTPYAADQSGALRTPVPIIETPQSVQVLTRTLIEEQDRRTLADALVNVSGVTPSKPEEAVLTFMNVRGFSADIFTDGLPGFGLTAVNDPTSLVGAERIEVLKGPTSTVYGGGVGAPLGGLINVVSKRPGDQLGGFVALRGGSFSTINPYGDINLPLGKSVAVRIVGEYQSNESAIDLLEGKRWSIQPSLLFTLAPQTELLLRAQIGHRSQLEYSGLPAAQAIAGQIDRNAFPGIADQPRTVIENQLFSAELRHSFSDTVRLTVTGRYYDSDFTEYGSFVFPSFYPPEPATPTRYALLKGALPTKVKEGTVDANLFASVEALGGRHALLAGINYDRTSYDAAIGFDFTPAGTIDLARPVYDVSWGTAPALTGTETDDHETIALYVQDQATYGPLHLTGSLRWTALKFRQQELATDTTYHKLSPRIGATLDVADGVALFAGYATGFRAAVNFIGAPGAPPPKPESSRSVEGGVKLGIKRFGLSGTIAAFDLTRRNVATANPASPFTSIQTGEQRSRGVEADLVWEPTPAISILANYAYTDAKVTEDTFTANIGAWLARVPRNSGRIAARYRVLGGPVKGLSFGAGVTAVGKRPITLANRVFVPGYAVIDAQASYDFGRFSIAGSIANLGNRHAFDPYQYVGQDVVIPIQPRSGTITLKAKF